MNPNELFKGQKIDLECPNCNHKFTVEATSFFKSPFELKCPNCPTIIDTSGMKKDLEKAMIDLEKMFK